ncbi:hypothetical protein BRD17_04630 [Halobacteriales archaeon SW_7_68_16]|nr:MAG: hypothetical protein BRD17_04630 [Halobacteriales archaeon SW_7_68_16]
MRRDPGSDPGDERTTASHDAPGPFAARTAVDPAKVQSEDVVGVTERAAWIIDGATSITDSKVTPDAHATDGAWFVRALNDRLHGTIDDTDRTLREIVADALAAVAAEFDGFHGGDLDPADVPCCVMAGVRVVDGYLEYFDVGDCSLLAFGDERVAVRQPGPRPLDDQVVTRAVDIAAKRDVGPIAAREHVDGLLRTHRTLMHHHHGYPALSVARGGRGTHGAAQGRIPMDEVDSVLLFTDGYEPLAESYDLFDSWAAVRDAVAADGFGPTIDDLRHFETEVDPNGELAPRLKRSDDAGAVLLTR